MNKKAKIMGKFFIIAMGILIICIAFNNSAEGTINKTYNNLTKEAILKNAQGIETARVKLIIPEEYYVEVGKDIKVAEFKVNLSSTNYTNALKTIDFYNKVNMKTLNKNYTFKYKTTEKEQEYYNDCEKDKFTVEKNGTKSYKCTIKLREIDIEVWKNVSSKDLTKGIITIGIFTDTNKNERIEWIPTLFGTRIDDWAVYYTSNITKTEYQDTEDGNTRFIYGDDNKVNGETFTIGGMGVKENLNLSYIKIITYKEGNPTGDASLVLKAVDGNGYPTGSSLSTGTISTGLFNLTKQWIQINMSAVELINNTKYAIYILAPVTWDGLNGMRWSYNSSDNSYLYGNYIGSGDGGSSWGNGTFDMSFEIFGTYTTMDVTPPYFTTIPSSSNINYSQSIQYYNVTGAGTTNSNGLYFYAGTYAGFPYYQKSNLSSFIYYYSSSWWALGNSLGNGGDIQYVSYNSSSQFPSQWDITYYGASPIPTVKYLPQFSASDNLAVDCFSVNDSRFTITCDGILNETQTLGAGTYNLNITVNDTSNNINSTIYQVIINKANSQTSLTFDKTSPQDYGTSITPTCSNITGTSDVNLTNGTSDVAETLGAGTWNFNCSYAGNANYTASSNFSTFTINKISLYADLYSDRWWQFTYDGTPTTIIPQSYNFAGGDSDIVYNIYRDLVYRGQNDTIARAGTYQYKLNSTGGANYSSSGSLYEQTLTIDKGTASFGINFNNGNPITYGTGAGAEGTGCLAQLICNLSRNNVTVSSPDNTILGARVWNYNYSTDGNENYTASSYIADFTVNKASTSTHLITDPSSSTTFGTPEMFNCTQDNNQPTNLTIDYVDSNIQKGLYIDRGASNPYVSCTSNDNENYSDSNDQTTYYIYQASSQIQITFDKTSPQTYGTLVTPNCSITTGVGTPTMTLDSASIVNNVSIKMSANPSHNLQCSLASTQNYSEGMDFQNFQIDKNASNIKLWLNNSQANTTLVFGQNLTVNATRDNGEGMINITKTPIIIPYYNVTGAGTTADNGNYDYAGMTVDVGAGNQPVPYWKNGSIYIYRYGNYWMIGTDITTGGHYYETNDYGANLPSLTGWSVYSGGSNPAPTLSTIGFLINQGNPPLYNLTTFNTAGIYQFNASNPETENYTASEEIWYADVSDTTLPYVAFVSPINTTYLDKNISININSLDASSVWWFNGITNLSYSSAIQYNFSYGSHTIIAYANDTSNNVNSTSITFTIATPKINMQLITPDNLNNLNVTQNTFFNVTVNVSCENANCGEVNVYLDPQADNVNCTVSGGGAGTCIPNDLCYTDGTYFYNDVPLGYFDGLNGGIKWHLDNDHEIIYTGGWVIGNYASWTFYTNSTYSNLNFFPLMQNWNIGGDGYAPPPTIICEASGNFYQEFSQQNELYSTNGGWDGGDVGHNLHDGDWETGNGATGGGGLSTAYLDEYYAIPQNVDKTNTKWEVKDDIGGQRNLTIIDSCWNYDSQKVKLRLFTDNDCPAGGSSTDFQCYNGSWESLSYNHNIICGITGNYIYEDAMNWAISGEAGSSGKGLINTTEGATPFYTNSTNPINITLSKGQSQIVTFYVNATGDIATNYTFFAYSNKTSDKSISNTTGTWDVFITANSCSLALAISDNLSAGVNWNIASLPEVNLSALGNNGLDATTYYVNVSAENCKGDLYLKADGNLINGVNNIPLDNEKYSYSNSNNIVPSNIKTSLTTDFQLIDANLTTGLYYFKFYLNVSGNTQSGNYLNSLQFVLNQTT